MKLSNKKMSTNTIVLGAILTALVTVLQLMGAFIKLGPFSVSLVLIPIVIGAATCGIAVSSWLGLVFGIAVLISGDAAAFLAISVPGTVITVLAKGVACGFFAGLAFKGVLALLDRRSKNQIAQIKREEGLCECCEDGVYRFLSRNNKYIATLVAAIVCPAVNTGVFLLGCLAFFMEAVSAWAGDANIVYYMFIILVGANFLFELGTDIILSPVVVRLLNIRAKKR